MNMQNQVNVDEMERKLSKISTLTRELSKLSSKEEDTIMVDTFDIDTDADDQLAATKYWKDYHDYFSKLSTVKKEIGEFRNMNHEYTGDDDFEVEKFQKFNSELDRAIRATNKSYKDFNGFEHQYIY